MWLHGGRFCPCSQEHPVRFFHFSAQQPQPRISGSRRRRLILSSDLRNLNWTLQFLITALPVLNQTKIWSTVLSGFCSESLVSYCHCQFTRVYFGKIKLIPPPSHLPLRLDPPLILPLRLRPLCFYPSDSTPFHSPSPTPPPRFSPSPIAAMAMLLQYLMTQTLNKGINNKWEDSPWVRKRTCWPLWQGPPWPLPGQSSPMQ